MGFAVRCPLAQHRMPLIRFLYIGPYVCSALLSDPASRRRPCASLLLHLHQVVEGTFTPELSNMLGTHRRWAALQRPMCGSAAGAPRRTTAPGHGRVARCGTPGPACAPS
jgi:hypothetical protein